MMCRLSTTLLLAAGLAVGSANAAETGITGYYFDNEDFAGDPVLVQVDDDLTVDWGDAQPVGSSRAFSVRWIGQVTPQVSGSYQLISNSASRIRELRSKMPATPPPPAWRGSEWFVRPSRRRYGRVPILLAPWLMA
ncbi:MAG: PA14 domain-containing protein [Planctomycetota bacterium]|jgi:hypothetical protein